MTRPASVFLLAALPLAAAAPFATSLPAQTSTTHKATTTTHHATSATTRPTTAASKADNPPGVPPVSAPPKQLYALRYVDIVTGTGPLAIPQKFYTVKYTGWLTDGTKFDSSYDHPGQEPITFAYGAHRVIPGWDTGFAGMRVGGKRRLYIPYQLAYGEAGREGAIPPKADLIFDIELVNFADAPPAPAAPASQPSATPPPNPSEAPANPSQSAPPDAPAPHTSTNPN